MCVCLIGAPIVAEFSDAGEITSRAVARTARDPQLGILSLAAVLQAQGEGVRIFDLNGLYIRYAISAGPSAGAEFAEYAARSIATKEEEVYGFSSICSSYPLTLRIAKALKLLRPDSAVLLGGPQASVVDLQTLTVFPFIDLVLRGEAEQTLPQLLDQLRGTRKFDRVPGLTYRVGSELRRNPNAPVIEDLDALPSPAYHLTDWLRGADKADLELGRGCPFSCTFCSTNDFFRRRFRLRSPERVLSDMRVIAATYSIHDFELIHDLFTVDRRRVAAFCETMIASGKGFTWSCSARTDCVDEELLELMARAGCRGIFYGVEVGSGRMQKIIDKQLDVQRAHQVIDATERMGIQSTVSLITGFPEETWDDIRQTLHVYMHSSSCPHSDPQLNLLAPLAETPLYSKYRNTLLLEELCSDMSHQARSQNVADLQLIRSHPEIFPNFYVVPTPHLERDALRELWEFTLMATARFRWMLVAIDQNSSGILDFFMVWREHRQCIRPSLGPSDLRHYYRTRDFRTDFAAFVRAHKVGKTPAVKTLLDFEDALGCSVATDTRTTPSGDLLSPSASLCPDDIPVRRERTLVFELTCDIQRVIDGLKFQKKPVRSRGSRFYVTRPMSAASTRIDRISNWMAHLLRLCDGRQNVRQIVPQMSAKLPEVQKSLREYVCMRLLEGARAERFIDVYRVARPAKTPAEKPQRPTRLRAAA
jgi:radical SAM superfamily enzyme YgiQ (UPF0313 family)